MNVIATVFCGGIVGFGFALIAGGGSILAVPLLVYGLKLQAHTAVCVSMSTIALLSLISTVQKLRVNEIHIQFGLFIGLAGVVLAPIGARLNQSLSHRSILLLFAFVSLLAGTRMFLAARNHRSEENPAADSHAVSRYTAALLVGSLAGFMGGLLGIGAGFIIVPSLVLFFGLPIHRAIATAFLSIALIASSATLSHLALGQRIPFPIAGFFIFGAIAGLALGILSADKLPSRLLQQAFAILVLCVALAIILRR